MSAIKIKDTLVLRSIPHPQLLNIPRIEAQRDVLPREQYTHLLRFAQTKKASDLTPWDLFEVSTWLKCMPSDFVTLD